jgi:hypothetical protein
MAKKSPAIGLSFVTKAGWRSLDWTLSMNLNPTYERLNMILTLTLYLSGPVKQAKEAKFGQFR